MRILRLPRLVLALAIGNLVLPAQPPASGLPPEWETRKLLTNLVETAKRLEPLLAQLNPQDWVANGAPETYVQQWQNTRKSLEHLQWSADRFAKESDRLSYALDTFFRVQAMEQMLNSLSSGVRRYHNSALSDLIIGIANENSTNKDALRQYMTDLAVEREREFRLVDSEAQRCRGILSREAPSIPQKSPAPARTKKKE